MQPTISSQLQAYEEYLILRNFSSATRQLYLRTIKGFLRHSKRKHPSKDLSQDLARDYILMRLKKGRSWSTINI